MTRLASVAGAVAAVAVWHALDQIAMRLDAIDHQLAAIAERGEQHVLALVNEAIRELPDQTDDDAPDDTPDAPEPDDGEVEP